MPITADEGVTTAGGTADVDVRVAIQGDAVTGQGDVTALTASAPAADAGETGRGQGGGERWEIERVVEGVVRLAGGGGDLNAAALIAVVVDI